MDYIKRAVEFLVEETALPISREKSVKSERAFTRNRKMSFTQLVYFILNGVKTTTQTALNRYFTLLEKDIHMSQSALSQARNKMNHYIFKRYFEITATLPYKNEVKFRKCKGIKYKGKIVSAIDGTQVKLPYTAKLKEHFGTSGQLSGITVNTIYQDVYISLFMANIVATAKSEADRKISQERSDKGNKYQYQANTNDIIGSFKDRFILACMDETDSRADSITAIINEIARSVVPIRPDRSTLRPITTRKMRFYHNHKLNC